MLVFEISAHLCCLCVNALVLVMLLLFGHNRHVYKLFLSMYLHAAVYSKEKHSEKSSRRLHGGDPRLLCDMACAASMTPTISVTATTTVRCDLSILLLSW